MTAESEPAEEGPPGSLSGGARNETDILKDRVAELERLLQQQRPALGTVHPTLRASDSGSFCRCRRRGWRWHSGQASGTARAAVSESYQARARGRRRRRVAAGTRFAAAAPGSDLYACAVGSEADRPPERGPRHSASGKDQGFGCSRRLCQAGFFESQAQIALEIRKLAALELGVLAEDPPSSLLRNYVERKLPSGDFRTLSLLASFVGHMWQQARETDDNLALESWASRLMLFIDQTYSEGGETQLSWLLMALPEPNFSVLVKRASGIRPFSRLCPSLSLWMSAYIAFLREMDWLRSRVGAAPPSSQPSNSAKKEEQTELDPAPNPNPKKPRRPRKPAAKALADAPSNSAAQ